MAHSFTQLMSIMMDGTKDAYANLLAQADFGFFGYVTFMGPVLESLVQ